MMKFEPRLHIDGQTAGQIEDMLMPLLESPTVVITDGYPFPLAAETVRNGVLVRAATGDEVTAFLTMGDVPNPDDFAWPGDPAFPAGREIEWQEKQEGEVQIGDACHLWGGEVLLKSGSGSYSPFYVHEEAARSWALASALSLPESDILELQVVPYICVRHFAPALIIGGHTEFKRLYKFWISPVRGWGQVVQFPLPGKED